MLTRLAVIVASLALLAIPTAAHADTSDFEFESFDADYTLSQAADGTSHLEVVETIVADFPDFDQNRGIVRAIPRFYNKVNLNLRIESVTDENGTNVHYEVDEVGDFTTIPLGTDDYVHGRTTYVIRYSIDNVVGSFADTNADEFYWDVNGTGWDQPFGRVSVTLHVDPALAPTLTGDAACYQGAQNSTTTCDIVQDATAAGGPAFTASTGPLDPREGLTIAVGFAPDTFVQGEIDPQFVPVVFTHDTPWWAIVLAVLSVLGTAAMLAGAIAARARRSAAAPREGFVVPQYTVPKNLSVMVAAHFVGRPATAVAAEFVGLAVRKNIRILDYAVTPGSSAEYTLQFLSDDGADSFDLAVLGALFGTSRQPGMTRELEPADESLGTVINGISSSAAAAVQTSGLRPPRTSWGCLVPLLAGLLLVLAVIGQVLALAMLTDTPVPAISILLTFGLLVATWVVSLGKRHPLSAEGQTTKEYLEGLRMYMQLAEKERFAMLQSPDGAERVDVGDTRAVIKLYEKLLPWAVMWGVEEQWAKELEVHAASVGESPDWFVSNNAFSAYALTSALSGVASTSTYTAPPPVSSSSSSFGGSSGGGFSGGGGGGGGGGGR